MRRDIAPLTAVASVVVALGAGLLAWGLGTLLMRALRGVEDTGRRRAFARSFVLIAAVALVLDMYGLRRRHDR